MFYWKNISSDEMGIVVSKTPTISKGKRNIEKISIPGRSGFLTFDHGTYESFIISVECHFNKGTTSQDELLAWLDGLGKLSLDNVRQWDAVIINSISLEKVIGLYRSFLIQFECQPIAEAISENIFVVSTSPATLNITGATAQMEPILEITGTGDVQVSINNKTFYLYGIEGKYILDSKWKVITNSNGLNASSKMLYEFPVLNPGINEIEYLGNITEFKIKYHPSYV